MPYEEGLYRVDTVNCGTTVKEGCFYFRMEKDDFGTCPGAVIAAPTEADNPSMVDVIVPVVVMTMVVLALIAAAIVAAAVLRRRRRR